MIPSVFVLGEERVLVLRCETEKEAGRAWTRLETLASCYNVSKQKVHVWVGFDYEFLSAAKANRFWGQSESEGQGGSQTSFPKSD